MNDLSKMVQEAYADCITCQEVAEVYANLMLENQKQMELVMQDRIKFEVDETW